MKKLFKPNSLLLYFLTLIVFFLGGMYFAAVSGAAEGQGLAGGAIVLFYGVVSAGLALIGAFFFVFYAPEKAKGYLNRFLAIVVVIFLSLSLYRSYLRERAKKTEDPEPVEQSPVPTPQPKE